MRTRPPYIPRDTSSVIPPKASITSAQELENGWVNVLIEVEGQPFEIHLFGEHQIPQVEHALAHLGTDYIVDATRDFVMILGRDQCHETNLRWPEPDEGSTWLRTQAKPAF